MSRQNVRLLKAREAILMAMCHSTQGGGESRFLKSQSWMFILCHNNNVVRIIPLVVHAGTSLSLASAIALQNWRNTIVLVSKRVTLNPHFSVYSTFCINSDNLCLSHFSYVQHMALKINFRSLGVAGIPLANLLTLCPDVRSNTNTRLFLVRYMVVQGTSRRCFNTCRRW